MPRSHILAGGHLGQQAVPRTAGLTKGAQVAPLTSPLKAFGMALSFRTRPLAPNIFQLSKPRLCMSALRTAATHYPTIVHTRNQNTEMPLLHLNDRPTGGCGPSVAISNICCTRQHVRQQSNPHRVHLQFNVYPHRPCAQIYTLTMEPRSHKTSLISLYLYPTCNLYQTGLSPSLSAANFADQTKQTSAQQCAKTS